MPDDQLEDVASKLDAQITEMIGKSKSSPTSPSTESQESLMHPKVMSILKEGGCSDPEGTKAKLEAAGVKFDKADDMPEDDMPKDDMPKDDMMDDMPSEGDDFGKELAKLPMKDARAGAAKAAYGSMGK